MPIELAERPSEVSLRLPKISAHFDKITFNDINLDHCFNQDLQVLLRSGYKFEQDAFSPMHLLL